jgi:hypothetical protein
MDGRAESGNDEEAEIPDFVRLNSDCAFTEGENHGQGFCRLRIRRSVRLDARRTNYSRARPASAEKCVPTAYDFRQIRNRLVPHSRRGHNWHSLGPHLKSTLQAADIFRPTREFNMKDAHNKAAEQHETAAKSHRAAADAHDKNDHTKGKEYSTQAQQHAQNANDQSKAAHAKSQQQK